MGERVDRGCFVGPLVQFDRDRFRNDVNAEIKKLGYGAQARVAREAGLARTSFERLINKNCSLRSVDALFSIAAYLRLNIDDYMIFRDEMNPRRYARGASHRGIDWKLFGGCAALLCGGSVHELSRIGVISLRQAAHILGGEGCSWRDFYRLCEVMGLPYDRFHSGNLRQQRTFRVEEPSARDYREKISARESVAGIS